MVDGSWPNQAVTQRASWFSRVFVANDFAEHLPTLVSELEAALHNTDVAIKHDRTTTVLRLELSNGDFVLKRYNPRNQWHKVKRALRGTRANRCWLMSYAFEQAGLNVARPILMVEKRFGPIRQNAYFVNEHLPGRELLTLLPTMGHFERKAVLNEVRDAFDKMRDAKITHGDMKASNLIWSRGRLFFIDLDAAAKHRSRVTWSQSHNKDRKRFMKNWANESGLLELFKEFSTSQV